MLRMKGGAIGLILVLAWLAAVGTAAAQTARQARILVVPSRDADSTDAWVVATIAETLAKYPDFVLVDSDPDRVLKVLAMPLDDSTHVVSWVVALPAIEPDIRPQLIHHQLEIGELESMVTDFVDLLVRATRKSLEAERAPTPGET